MKSLLAVILIFGAAIGIATFMLKENQDKRELPILNPSDINPDLVDPSIQNKGLNHTVSEFYLQNQDGEWVNEKIIKGKIAIVNYFFTTCPGICPAMNKKVSNVHNAFSTNDAVIILSHTVMPEVDSAEVLKKYAELYDAGENWVFLTGDKQHLYDLARKSYLISPDENNSDYQHNIENDFIHTENLALIDEKGRIRGFYNGLKDVEINQLIKDIELLLAQMED